MRSLRSLFQGGIAPDAVQATVDDYARRFDDATADRGEANGAAQTKRYYQLATDFYEYGWGQSFHFAPRNKGESLKASLARHEHHLAQRLGLTSGHKVLDVGCGVGGPMRSIARFSGAHLTGITLSPYQIERARVHTEKAGLSPLCEFVEGDFNRMPFEDARFDAAFSIEACCHAADRRGPFREVFRTLKPGGLFAGYDWCMTRGYSPGDRDHERIKLGIEKGNGIAPLVTTAVLETALKDVGFELLEAKDWALTGDPERPWYAPLDAGMSLTGFRNSRAGAFMTHQIVRALEALKLSPQGTVQMHDVLRLAQRALVEGGRRKLFTPMYFWVARKPGAN